MENRTYYNEILTEHNIHPTHKHKLMESNRSLRGVNPSCGDDITLSLKVSDDGVIEDGAFIGDGCAVSQASCDMMLDLVVGRTTDEAMMLKDTFLKMIKDEVSEDELESLEEAVSLRDIAHMPARVKCAVLGWHTMEEALSGTDKSSVTTE